MILIHKYLHASPHPLSKQSRDFHRNLPPSSGHYPATANRHTSVSRSGKQSEYRSDRGHQDRTEPLTCPFDNRLPKFHSSFTQIVYLKGLADEVFLRERCEGYEAFLPIVRKSTPKWAEQITGIPEKNILRLALFFGQAKAPAILLGSGFSRYGNGGMTSRLITRKFPSFFCSL